MRASRVWAQTWPSARGEPLLVSTRDPRPLPESSTICCDAPGYTERARFEVVVRAGNGETFARCVCGAFSEHPKTRSVA